jgi:hypothetical protein
LFVFENSYDNIQITAIRETFDVAAEGDIVPTRLSPMRKKEYSVKCRNQNQEGKYWCVNALDLSDIAEDEKQQFVPARQVLLLTPTKAYGLTKQIDSAPYYSLNLRHSLDTFLETEGIPLLYFNTAPFAERGTTLDRLLFYPPPFSERSKKNYVIDSVKQINEIEPSIEIHSHIEGSVSRWIITLSTKSQSIIKTDYCGADLSGKKYWETSECVYEGEIDNVPLLKTYQMESGDFSSQDKEQRIPRHRVQYTITNLIPGPPDLSEFDVAQFLPPGVKIGEEITFARLSTARITAIVISTLLIIFGIAWKIWYALYLRNQKNQQKKGE